MKHTIIACLSGMALYSSAVSCVIVASAPGAAACLVGASLACAYSVMRVRA